LYKSGFGGVRIGIEDRGASARRSLVARRFALGPEGLWIDANHVDRPLPLAWYTELLGAAPRTEVPEVARLRPDLSNKLHIFDSIGIVLNEHHAHKLVFAVTFAFVPEETAGRNRRRRYPRVASSQRESSCIIGATTQPPSRSV
jgi:hypothetical protein